ncbi:Type-2Aa cytolytic delta-endotoxin [Streptomyces yunnanensis]|uniref:Type-2Aa cytolytic delta-endotoxin n=1 Tax=Streptomyces yunnanensis TaxID=156453 RepID=A0ABY8A3Y0_9ACTN|nr:Type-2Aa cytolytic delta-endotoxin [Streptomyces yunnanensis]WEB38501.1 Type-2Aa cytolytic delta-endotoxin [Streptomyces yunnanensis]
MSDQPATSKTTFKAVFEVRPDVLEQAQALAEKFQYAIAPATVDFDFGEISRAASAVPDGATVKIVRGWGLQETAPVGVMVMSLREAVRQALGQPFGNPAFWERAEAALTEVFVGLGRQEGTHLSFYGDAPDSTGYYYNLLFALHDEETEGFVYALAFCVNVTIGLSADKAGALASDDVAQCAIRVNAITVRQPVRAAA